MLVIVLKWQYRTTTSPPNPPVLLTPICTLAMAPLTSFTPNYNNYLMVDITMLAIRMIL